MSNLYAIPTTTGMITHNGHRERGEWAVERQLREMGAEPHDTRSVVFKRAGKRRYAEPEFEPALPGYVFASIPDEVFGKAVHAKGAWGSALYVQPRKGDGPCPCRAVMAFVAVLAQKRLVELVFP